MSKTEMKTWNGILDEFGEIEGNKEVVRFAEKWLRRPALQQDAGIGLSIWKEQHAHQVRSMFSVIDKDMGRDLEKLRAVGPEFVIRLVLASFMPNLVELDDDHLTVDSEGNKVDTELLNEAARFAAKRTERLALISEVEVFLKKLDGWFEETLARVQPEWLEQDRTEDVLKMAELAIDTMYVAQIVSCAFARRDVWYFMGLEGMRLEMVTLNDLVKKMHKHAMGEKGRIAMMVNPDHLADVCHALKVSDEPSDWLYVGDDLFNTLTAMMIRREEEIIPELAKGEGDLAEAAKTYLSNKEAEGE